MSMKEQYAQKLQDQLDEWSVEIERLSANLPKAGSEAREQYAEQIESLSRQEEVASKKLTELRAAGDSVWEDLKVGIESIWMDLSEGMKKMGEGLENE